MAGHKRACAGLEVLRFRPVKSRRADDGLELRDWDLHVVPGGFTAIEKDFCDLIHAHIRALGGKNRRHQKLQGGLEVQLAVCVGIGALKNFENGGNAGAFMDGWHSRSMHGTRELAKRRLWGVVRVFSVGR